MQTFYTQKSLHHKRVFTQGSLHTKFLTRRSLHAQRFSHRETFFQTKQFFDRGTFTHRSFYQKTPLPRESFTRRNSYVQKLLHQETLTHRRFFAQFFFRKIYRNLYKETCTHRRVSIVALQETHLPILHHVSPLLIIPHLSSSFPRFYALLVNSLFTSFLFCMLHSVLSVHACTSLPLRRSKLNVCKSSSV